MFNTRLLGFRLLGFTLLSCLNDATSGIYGSNSRGMFSIVSSNSFDTMKMISYERHCFRKNISNYGVTIRNFSSTIFISEKLIN
jgi:hypothetical protein